jgi:CHAD domain-containing protein
VIRKFRRDCPQRVKSGLYLALVTNSSNRNTLADRKSKGRRDPAAHASYLFRKLSRLLRANQSAPDAESVHELRTTVRRIQTLAASLGEEESKAFSKFDKIVSDIFEKAGRVRDLDVQMVALKTISLPSVEDDKAILQNYLQRQRSKRQRKLAATIEEERAKRLPKRQRKAKALLLKVVEQPADVSGHAIDLRKEVLPFIEKLRANHFDVETLHEVRLAVKHVRYAAEAAGERGAELVALLKPVQDVIGEWHDWLNLIETADEVLGPLPGHPLMTVLRSKVRARFHAAISAVKPLEARLAEAMQLTKGPGPVLVRQEIATAANAS